MSDPVVVPVTGWRSNPVLVRIFSVHTLLAVLAVAFFVCSHVPRLAGLADLINAAGLLFGAAAWQAAQEWQSPQVRAKLTAGDVPRAAGAPDAAGGSGGGSISTSALPIVFLTLLVCGLSACAGTIPPGPVPDPQAYVADFKACLSNEGLSSATPEAAKIFQILDQGGNSTTEIEQKIEAVALTVTADAATICIDCAVIAWTQSNPVAVNAKPSPAQAAARLFLAKHMTSPTVSRHLSKESTR